jgi:predicted amino acid racemase
MFLQTTIKRNNNLIKTAVQLHQQGVIQPDTYVLDLDTIINNGRLIQQQADSYGIKLYFMTKQFGRNPLIAKELMKLGYVGAVAVDFKEAELLAANGIRLGHVGHLTQIPSGKVPTMLNMAPGIITVYSVEKAEEISRAAKKMGIVQKIMLRTIGPSDILYPAQYGGICLDDVVAVAQKIAALPNVKIHGLTSFPCFLLEKKLGRFEPTPNVQTMLIAEKILKEQLGIQIMQMNMPSGTCVSSIPQIAKMGGTHGEPGHGLLGTTPLHAIREEPEIPGIVYVSEISHQLGDVSYCYGGGYYRRSNMVQALVGRRSDELDVVKTEPLDNESIDYHIGLKCRAAVGETVVFSFRTQVFVTRSEVAVVKGISTGKGQLMGIYDSLGRLIKRGE